MKKTSLIEIAKQMGLEAKDQKSNSTVPGVAVDSRLLRFGDLFFALPGAQVDGHDFLQEAALKGASGAVVHIDYSGPDYGLILLRSPDVLKSLQALAKFQLSHSKMRVAAVTGSLGKTTTKDFVATLLKSKFRVSSSPGNSNSQIGLPLTILNNTEFDDDILVVEMGMTHPGQIKELINIAPPEVAIVTKVALVHACNFNALQDIARAKAEIFSHPCTKLGIYNLDSDLGGELSKSGSCKKFSFSVSSSIADYYLLCESNAMKVIEYGRASPDMPLLKLPGAHNRHNLIGAIALARHFGIDWNEIITAIETLKLPERRLEIIHKNGVVFVNDSYNASEVSVKAALDTMPVPKNKGRKIAVLSEMMELGKFSEQCHRAVGEHALQRLDLLYCFGEGCKPIYDIWTAAGRPIVWGKDRSEVVNILRTELRNDDVVLLKGARSKGVWKVLEEVYVH